jgi:hypothetical protein
MWSLFSSRRRKASRPRRATTKPRLESLEDRCVPSAFAASLGSPNVTGLPVGSGQGVGTDAMGNVYTVGNIGGTLSSSDTDGVVAKYSPDGTLLWKQVIQGLDPGGNSFADSADCITVDSAGNSYVAGTFRATVQLGNFSLTSTGVLDVFVEKLDTSGNALWVHQFANVGNFYSGGFFGRNRGIAPEGIAVDNAGNVVIADSFTGHLDLDPGNPGQHFLDYPAPGQSGHPDGCLVKLNPDGTFAWDAQVVNVPLDGAGVTAVAMDGQGNVYAMGTLANDNYFNDATNNNSIQQNANSIYVPTSQGLANVNELYLWKLNANGTNVFVRPITSQPDPTDPFAGFTATGPRAAIWGLGLAIDGQGNIYVTGAFNDKSVDFSPGVFLPGNPTSGPNIVGSPNGNYDTFVEKMDSNGNWQWVSQITASTAADNGGTGIALDSAGNPYITGFVTGDSMLGNILLTPASSAGNSYIAELDPHQGTFLNAVKSVDSSPDGDQAAAIAVDPQGFVDIVGTYAANMTWPGLPTLNGTSGGEIFTVKTGLSTPAIAYTLVGTTELDLTAVDDQPKQLVITQDTQLGTRIQLDSTHLVAFSGLRSIIYNGSNGGNTIDFLSRSDDATRPPDLTMNLGGQSTVNVTAAFTANPFLDAPWTLRMVSAGAGATFVHTSIFGSVPVATSVDFGTGTGTAILEHNGIEEMTLPETVSVKGGLVDDIKVVYGFILQSEAPGDIGQPININIDGAEPHTIIANNELDYGYANAQGLQSPPSLNIPVSVHVHDAGNDTVNVAYHFHADTNRRIIFINAPLTVDVSGPAMRKVLVDFDADIPAPGTIMPTLEIFSPLVFHVTGGTDLGLNFGVPDFTGDPSIGNPDLMPGGSVDARFVGNSATNTLGTVGIDIWTSPASQGQVTASAYGGYGNDTITLDIHGIDDSLVQALINGRRGHNTAHATANVHVFNCDLVFIDP